MLQKRQTISSVGQFYGRNYLFDASAASRWQEGNANSNISQYNQGMQKSICMWISNMLNLKAEWLQQQATPCS